MEKICVAVRVRPSITQENINGSFWMVDSSCISLHSKHGTPVSSLSFEFDHVFDQDCTNARVYELHTKDVIQAAVNGFNGTAFAYGQTSSGKTFTMNGSLEDPGIIRLAVQDIFKSIKLITEREFLIRVSYLEIYNEEINDLFALENQKLQVHESLERGVFVSGLREEIVNRPEDILRLIELGESNRHVGQTNMNARSSRSHTIFRMVIESRGKDAPFAGDTLTTDAVRVSVLNLVDLAGSERIAKTGADGVRLKEGKNINKSLMVLGTVINKLSDNGGKQRGHIPYRDSKLTRILQPALGGNAKTSIICTIAPEEAHIDETRGTLQFASRAKRITNCARVNEILTDAALLKRQKQEIEELRRILQGSHSEVLEQEILKLRNEMLKFESEREKLAWELEQERKLHKERDREQQMKIDNLSSLICSDQDRNSAKTNSCEHSFPRRLSLDFLDQGKISFRRGYREGSIECHSTPQKDAFQTPSFKSSNACVGKHSSYQRLPDASPIPDEFVDFADEDMWEKLNKGHCTPDFDMLCMTPEGKYPSLAASNIASGSCSLEFYKEELENLKKQWQCVLDEKNEVSRSEEFYKEEAGNLKKQLQCALNEKNELEREAVLARQFPEKISEAVADCKDILKEVFSKIQSCTTDEESLQAVLLSCARDIGISLLTTLEGHFSRFLHGETDCGGADSLIEEQCRLLTDKLSFAVATLNSPQSLKENNELKDLNLELNNQLVAAKEKRESLERQCKSLREERDSLLQFISKSTQNLAMLTSQKEEIAKVLSIELQRREALEEELRQFRTALSQRFTSFASTCHEIRANARCMKTFRLISESKAL
ncbi:hypothetical protein AMTRI_Chr12g238850 [Amborella trichopoda]